jgi:hypothetical protein
MTTEEFNQQVQQILQLASNKEAFFKLCDLYVIASDKQRKEIRQNYFFERDWEAPDHHSLAAHLPGEPDREARIRASLILLSFSASDDFRDNLVTVAVLWNSLKDMGKDADAWFGYFAELSSAQAASAMTNFAARRAEEKELEKWGYQREITEQGIVYRGWEFDEEKFKRLGIL